MERHYYKQIEGSEIQAKVHLVLQRNGCLSIYTILCFGELETL